MEKTITVATACYDKDWNVILSTGYLAKIFGRFNYSFDKKLLIINAMSNREEITKAALREVSLGNLDEFYFTEDLKDEVMKFFRIKNFIYTDYFSFFKKGFDVPLVKRFYHFYFRKKGKSKIISLRKKQYDCYDYSISPLCAIYKATTDFILYFTEDCAMDKNNKEKWIENGISIIEDDNSFIAARPIDEDLDRNYYDEYESINDFYISSMFTDRMFLAKVRDLKEINFNCEDQKKYPPYGGAGFEAKIYNYMATSKKFMLVSHTEKFIHEYEEYINGINMSSS